MIFSKKASFSCSAARPFVIQREADGIIEGSGCKYMTNIYELVGCMSRQFGEYIVSVSSTKWKPALFSVSLPV